MSSWLVITGSVIAITGAQSVESRYPVQEFPSLEVCLERLMENDQAGIYDAFLAQQIFELTARFESQTGRHPADVHVRLKCEGQ